MNKQHTFTLSAMIVGVVSIALWACSGTGQIIEQAFARPTPTLTMQEVYAVHMSTALAEFDAYWNGSVLEFSQAMRSAHAADLLPLLAGGGVPATELKERNTSPEVERLLDAMIALVPLAEDVSGNGYRVLSQLTMKEPPQSVQLHHNDLVNCVRWRIAAADATVDLINSGIFADPGPDLCRRVSEARDILWEYVHANIPTQVNQSTDR